VSKQQFVYVIAKDGTPLMPTKKFGMVRHFLDEGKAKPVQTKPFTIQLTYETEHHTQPVKVGIDTGYNEIGVSAVSTKAELFAAEIELVSGISERMEKRRKYRQNRRSRKRHRPKRFDNRKKSKPKGWLAPSIKHKKNSHLRFIKNEVATILPVDKITLEVANFDIQKIKDPSIEGKEYQQGEQLGFFNLRKYILHRDNHECQNPNCNNKGYDHRVNGRKKKAKPLQIHHIGYWKNDRSDRPGNLITLCTKCHTPTKHKEGNLLWGWEPEVKSFRSATFMSMVRWRMLDEFKKAFPNTEVDYTYGYITQNKRIDLDIPKSHSNDAFVITEDTSVKTRFKPYCVKQVRRNNRSLEKFYDAKYKDLRDGKTKSGQDLADQRRSKDKTAEKVNLRKFRGHKTKKGGRRIRKERYPLQPHDVVIYKGDKRDAPVKCTVKGTFNKGKWIRLKDPQGNTINSNVEDVEIYRYGKGFCFKEKIS